MQSVKLKPFVWCFKSHNQNSQSNRWLDEKFKISADNRWLKISEKIKKKNPVKVKSCLLKDGREDNLIVYLWFLRYFDVNSVYHQLSFINCDFWSLFLLHTSIFLINSVDVSEAQTEIIQITKISFSDQIPSTPPTGKH